ncbi:putative baseplate assembly protein [Nocardia jinanensis]|uniref:Baseplate assembly protein n=1 Tax=Nocardia jinanensis TaxID=382504 RepID=A0A917VSY3_9NOCA|nr:putative baseplate assembly protein [Nocardia jinanensis]GGL14644.1 putative baseplate assembly protein [Nocardia jinanensis]
MSAIVAPDLDDRRYDDLVTQARSLIPRYLPEWTNHNDADPGITLLQLFAWFTDQLVYRVNQVPELHYVKFLQLLGIQARPARPARVDLTFATATAADRVVPAGTQVSGPGPDGKPVVFELSEGFTAIGAPLTAVQTFDGFAYRDVTGANTTADQAFAPFGPHAHENSALLLGFTGIGAGGLGPCTDNPITLMAYVSRGRAVPLAQAGALAVPPPARFAYQYWDGAGWEPLGVERDETAGFTATGRIVVHGPGSGAVRQAIGQVATPLYWLCVRMVTGTYERGPLLERIAPNTVPARAAVTLRDEVLGGSDGMPEQGPLTLSRAPVVPLDHPQRVRRADGRWVTVESLRLEIDEGSGFEVWQEVDDFGGSGPDDPHYLLDRNTGAIRFGDGRHGAIPTANVAAPMTNIVARRWVAGGGAATNLGAGSVTTLATVLPGIKTVRNELPAAGGADAETVDAAKLRAPAELQAKGRAVTAEDFELLARAAPAAAVARAHALALTHPRYPGVAVPGAITVLVVPDAPGNTPKAAPATLTAVCAWLDRHRLVTTEVFATCPTYRRVRVVADLVIAADADPAQVHRAVADALVTFLHPLRGGDDGRGWPFGGPLYSSDLFRVVLRVPGVLRVRDNQLTVELDEERQPFCRDIDLGIGELVEPLDPDLRVGYA